MERISIGSLALTGWTFADGAVRVIRSQGHCAGHVIVQLRDSRLLHMSDEANGPCGVMDDADQLKIAAALGAAVTMLEEEQVTRMTDGHSFVVAEAPDALSRLHTLLDQAVSAAGRVPRRTSPTATSLMRESLRTPTASAWPSWAWAARIPIRCSPR